MKDKEQQTLDEFINMRAALFRLEEDLGLSDLNENEIRVFCAAAMLLKDADDGRITTSDIREHWLCEDFSQAKFYRSMQTLTSRGLLKRMKDHEKYRNFDIGFGL